MDAKRKQNEQVLDEELLARAVLEQAADAIVVCNDKGQITRVSRTAEQLCGCSPLRANFDAAFPVVLASPLLGGGLTSNALQGAVIRAEPATLTRVDGAQADLLVSAIPLQATNGRIIGCVVTMVDVSQHRQSAEALRESQGRQRILVDTMLQGVVHQDRQGKIISMNFAAERILGKTRQEFLGSSSVHEEHHSIREDGSPFPGLEHPSMAALRTGQPIRNVVMGVFNPRESAYRWISIDAVPLFRPGEANPYEVYTVFADVTERRQAEQALRAGSAILNSVLDSSVSGIMAFKSSRDAQGRITDFEWQLCNATAERMVGRRASDLIGRRLLVEMPGNKAEGLFDKYVVVVESGQPLHHEHYYEHEGMKTWFETCAVQLGDGFAVTFSDITNRKRAQEALERSNQRLAEVLDSIQDDFYVLDSDWKFTFASKQFTSRIGKQPEDFLGHNIWEMFPKHLGTVYEENLRAAMDRRETRRFEIGGKYTDAWYRMTASPSAEGITVLGTEITENKRIEEALREANARLNEANQRRTEE